MDIIEARLIDQEDMLDSALRIDLLGSTRDPALVWHGGVATASWPHYLPRWRENEARSPLGQLVDSQSLLELLLADKDNLASDFLETQRRSLALLNREVFAGAGGAVSAASLLLGRDLVTEDAICAVGGVRLLVDGHFLIRLVGFLVPRLEIVDLQVNLLLVFLDVVRGEVRLHAASALHQQFAAVLCSDVLEHLAADQRSSLQTGTHHGHLGHACLIGALHCLALNH